MFYQSVALLPQYVYAYYTPLLLYKVGVKWPLAASER